MPIKILPDKTEIDFLKYHQASLLVSSLLVIAVIIGLFTKGLNFGIDFTGGSVIEVRALGKVPELSEMRSKFANLSIGEISLQHFGNERDLMIRVGGKANMSAQRQIEEIRSMLAEYKEADWEYRKIDFVGPQVGKELITDGIIATILAFLAIMVYLWIRFEWQYGIGAVVSLIHDAIMLVGFYLISGFEFNLTSIAVILTVIGYSVNDSVIIYDRIRENRSKNMAARELYNISLNETLSRTILTITTTLIAILALIIFGGEVVAHFSIAMFIGIVIGTYSSIYISVPLLLYLPEKKADESSN